MESDLTEAVRALAMASRIIEHALDDMTLAQFRVLTMVISSPERASRIAERAAMSKPTLSGLLDGLEARGWVRRVEVAGDRRGVRLEATRDGRAAQRTAQRSMAARLDDVLHDATADDRAAVLCGLSTLRTTLSARWTAPR